MNISRLGKTGLNPFFLFLILVATSWSCFVIYNDLFHLYGNRWIMAVTMIFGSFIAGSTCLGGGVVAFPVVTLVLNLASNDARDFSLMIQSIGMTSASVAILFWARIRVQWKAIFLGWIGGLIGFLVSVDYINALISQNQIKLIFTFFVAGFIYVLMRTSNKFAFMETHLHLNLEKVLLLVVGGFVGGVFSGLMGNGIDLVIFAILTLSFRIRIREATATSVIIMAGLSIMGFVQRYHSDDNPIQDIIWEYWIVSAPVVLFGAPLGSFVLSKISSKLLTYGVSFLFLVQCGFIVFLIPQTLENIILEVLVFSLSVLVFILLNKRDYSQYAS